MAPEKQRSSNYARELLDTFDLDGAKRVKELDHWGIQVRSLMPATFDAGGN